MAQFTATFTLGYTERFVVESGVGSITVGGEVLNLQATDVTASPISPATVGVRTITAGVALPFTLQGGDDGTVITFAADTLLIGDYI